MHSCICFIRVIDCYIDVLLKILISITVNVGGYLNTIQRENIP